MKAASNVVAGDFRRNPMSLLIVLILFVVGAYLFAQYVVNNNIPGLAYIALACLGATFLIGILNSWRNGLYLFITWLLFEDFARKFLRNNMAIYFAKDVLIVFVYVSFLMAYRRKAVQSFRPPFLVPALLFVWFGVMQVFNPASNTLVYGLLGVKVYSSYIPLVFLGYALINSEDQLPSFLSSICSWH